MTNTRVISNSASFYVIGGTLHRDARCYVTREADSRLYTALADGELCYVLTARQMGKSSLMVHTAARLRDAHTSVAVLDLTALGQNLSVEQWYTGLLERIGEQLDLEDELEEEWDKNQSLGPLQRWTAAVRKVLLERCPARSLYLSMRLIPFAASPSRPTNSLRAFERCTIAAPTIRNCSGLHSACLVWRLPRI